MVVVYTLLEQEIKGSLHLRPINGSLLQKLEVFSEDNATVSFGNCLTLSIFKFFKLTNKQTDELTDVQNRLLNPSRRRAQGK